MNHLLAIVEVLLAAELVEVAAMFDGLVMFPVFELVAEVVEFAPA